MTATLVPRVTDRILVPYIDPDSATGTSVRFINNIYTRSQVPNPNDYQRYLPAIGLGCDYLYANYLDAIGRPAGERDPLGAPRSPDRLLISVTTRYRTTQSVPFQFDTVSSEVNLEGLKTCTTVRPPER